jgi:hypothetical protein
MPREYYRRGAKSSGREPDVLEDFKKALARVQSDYGFYIECQANPAVALAGYDLSDEERLAISDPEKLADILKRGIGVYRLPPITIKICGTHDWINRAAAMEAGQPDAERDAKVATEVGAIRRAGTDEERTGAVFRLMEAIG